MCKESILVTTIGIRGGNNHTNKQGYVAVCCTPGFNEKQDRIVIDGFKGMEGSYEQREVALLSIQFKDGTQWTGTFSELSKALAVEPESNE